MIQTGARRITLVVLCCVLAFSSVGVASAREDRAAFVPEELLMSEREAEVFRALRHPGTREKFLERFWSERADQVRSDWSKRLPLATREFSDPASDRARIFLTAGPPLYRVADICPAPVRPHEIWYYSEDGAQTVVFIAAESGGKFRTWKQGDWQSLLGEAGGDTSQATLLSICDRGPELAAALTGSGDPQLLPGLSARDGAWVEEFLTETTLLPPDARPLDATIELDYPAAVGDRTAVLVTLAVPHSEAAGDGLCDFNVTGEVFGPGAVDAFRLHYSAAPQARNGQQKVIRLTARRHLPPGQYDMVLKLHDVVEDRYLRRNVKLDVPTLDRQEAGWAEPGQRLFKLMPPPEGYLTGSHRFETIASNPDVAKVSFFLDGERALTKNRPPFSVELDLGVVPRPREIEAVAFNADGYEIARDHLIINSGPHRFAVRLVEPDRGATTGTSFKVHAVVDTPLGERLSHVDFFWNEARLARLYQPPFVQTLHPIPSEGSSYIRAVAVLDDGHSAEDLVVVNTGDTIEAIEVDFVELYASVLGAEGSAVKDLERDQFRVFENGVEQELRRFETVEHLPVSAVVVLDCSTSMVEEIREVEKAAAQFFEHVLEPKDRAAVIIFNDVPVLRVALTNDIVLLNNGLAGIEADGETSLYDSLIYGLYYLAGLRGKRALILVSDGADSASDFSFEEALEFAERSGVAIYTIGLGLGSSDVAEHAVLRKLARETGGESFSIESARRIDRIYDRIEQDLRSQYLLGYQSPLLESREYREVRVEIARAGLEVKTVPGYYP
ncbi:MAG: VWA domain-containing protein [bacterium]|nr:VWA domain-containing protein [bacterium]